MLRTCFRSIPIPYLHSEIGNLKRVWGTRAHTERDNLEPGCRVRCPFVLLTVPTSHAAAPQIAKINRRLRESL